MQAASLELTTPAAWRQRGQPSPPLWRRSVTKLVVISPCWGARFLRFTISTHKGACEWRSPISRTAWPESRPRTKPDLIPGAWCCCDAVIVIVFGVVMPRSDQHLIWVKSYTCSHFVFSGSELLQWRFVWEPRTTQVEAGFTLTNKKFSCYDYILWNVTLLKISNGTNAPAGRPQQCVAEQGC